MLELFELFQFPFMQRALLAGVLLSLLLAVLGIFVILRRMAFIADGVAHASLAGIAIGLLSGFAPLPSAILWSIGFAAAVYFLEKKTSLPSDAIIGVLFTTGFALGVILMSLKAGYQPELMSYLFGNILAVQTADLLLISGLSVVILTFLAYAHRSLTLLALNPDLAYLSGVNVGLYQLSFYILLSVAVVLGVKLVGVVLVSALLVFPVSAAKLAARSFGELVWWTVLLAFVATVIGVLVSASAGLPTGPSIVLTNGVLFLGVLVFGLFRK